jgi:SAM-dependent methyltransferase
MPEALYRLPEYYDVAFGWEEITQEIRILRTCFARHTVGPVAKLLEPACGTGRFLIRFPHHGYRITGYDLSGAMVAYAQDRIQQARLEDVAAAVVADMRTASVGQAYDAAYNVINSIGYLHTDEDILAHLAVTAGALKAGGVYVIQLSCSPDDPQDPAPQAWTCERGGIRVRTTWMHAGVDSKHKLLHETCRMEITEPGGQRVLEDHHTMRLWTYGDLVQLVESSGAFEMVAIYTDRGERIPLTTNISGQHGNLYYVLARTP